MFKSLKPERFDECKQISYMSEWASDQSLWISWMGNEFAREAGVRPEEVFSEWAALRETRRSIAEQATGFTYHERKFNALGNWSTDDEFAEQFWPPVYENREAMYAAWEMQRDELLPRLVEYRRHAAKLTAQWAYKAYLYDKMQAAVKDESAVAANRQR